MALSLSAYQTRLLRLQAQRLYPSAAASFASPDRVLKDVFAVQAQDLPAAILSIRARSAGLTAAMVERARQEDRSIIWTWCMRGTLHLVHAQDAAWLIPFLGPQFIAADLKRFRQLGWDEPRANAGLRLLQDTLAERGGLTRPEIVHLLEENDLPAQGQAPVHLLYRAAMEGILCIGAEREKISIYVPFEAWLGKLQPLPRQDALAKIAQRYLEAYGPAGPEDLAAWSGLKLSDARSAWRLIAEQLVEVDATGRPSWMLKDRLPWLDERIGYQVFAHVDFAPVVRLLPRFDTYLLGYASRELIVEPVYARHIHPGGGLIYPVLLVDGRALGIWKIQRRRAYMEVVIAPFERLADELLPHIEVEVADLARFLDEEAVLIIDEPLHTP